MANDMKGRPKIPRLIHTFFKWYCKKNLYEELHGDLEEFYYERAEEKGLFKARLKYLWDVIRCFQPYAWKIPQTQNTTIMMFRNYYKTSIRSLMKNPLSSFINVFGLAAAIGICVFTYGFGQYIFNVDQFHEKKNEVYLATFFANRDGTEQQNGMTPRPLGEMLREDFTQIEKVCRVDDKNVVLKYEDKVFHERVRFTDPEFLELFTFPLKWGASTTIADPNSIILSHEMSTKYFGGFNPIGESILMKFSENQKKSFVISGVADPFPAAHTISFDFLINFENLKMADPEYSTDDWGSFVKATLIQVKDPTDMEVIEAGMEKYKKLQNAVENDWAISSFTFEQLATLYKNSSDIRSGISGRGFNDNYTGLIMLSIVALILLLLACFNYINISIVSAAKRLKEIGLRKVIGANRRMVITQFLIENIFLTFFATLLGLLFGTMVVIPWFERMWLFEMGLTFLDLNLWIYLGAIMLFTGIASGIYPAFYISKFQVVGILKGAVRFGKKNPLTKILLGFQLILACMLISSAVMFTQNTGYLANRSWGYNQEESMYALLANQSEFEQLAAVMSQNPNVLSLAGSKDHLGDSRVKTVVSLPDQEYEVDELSVSADYFETLGIELESGRLFQSNSKGDLHSLVVSKQFVTNLDLNEPIGTQVKLDSVNYEIIGVVTDIHMFSFSDMLEPMIFTKTEKSDYRYLSMRVSNASKNEVYKDLQAQWIDQFPEVPFQGGLQEDVWGFYFEEIGIHGKVWRGIAFIAILLASLGLYGLITLNVSGRVREFSIRKVLGALQKNIAKSIIRQYLVLFVIAFAIGAPVSYFMVDLLFDIAYVYHIPMNPLGLIISFLVLTLTLFVIVSTQVIRVTKSNSVEGLKVE